MTDYRLLWGDIHNHNELGYAQGSLARSYEIARSHLDFYAFTPHGIHADGGVLEGYPVVREGWDEIAAAARVHNEPHVFTTFLAYEWHSNQWGHVHIVHREDVGEMVSAPTLEALQAHYRGQAVMLVPHHTAYHQGVDWGRFDKALSPLVEIFSEHGCSERDVGPYPMLVHSRGPGAHTFTAQHGLALGKRFGFTAGTDNHDGYPGGYGLGLTGVWATANTREALWEAFQARRTTAVTGDRIDIEFSAGEVPMGSVVEGAEELAVAEEAGRLELEGRSWNPAALNGGSDTRDLGVMVDCDAILKAAEEHKADLIVMGSNGADGLQEIFIGSNTERVVRTSDVPVLVIKGNEVDNFNPKNFVFASDFEEESVPALKKAKEMAELLGSKLHLVYINTPGDEFMSTNDAYAKISKFLDEANVGMEVEIFNDYTVEKGVINFSKKIGADLIGIPTHGRRGLSHFFMGSIGEDIANHSEAPVITFKI